MLRKLADKIRHRRRFWRFLSFDDLSQLYLSSLFRNAAMSLVGIFMPIYLYKLDYSFSTIMLYMAMLAGLRCVVIGVVAGRLLFRYGAKLTLFASYVAQIVALLLLITLPEYHWPLLVLGIPWATSMGLYYVAYHLDFSQARDVQHTARDLSRLNILERIGAIAGPVAGGVVATMFGAQYTLAASLFLFLIAMYPLLRHRAVHKAKEHVRLRAAHLRIMGPHLASFSSFAIESSLTTVFWPLYVAVFIFVTNTYASIGLVRSLSFGVAVIATWLIGRLVDERKGRLLFTASVIANSVCHMFRPLVHGFGSVATLDIINDSINPGYRMPFLRAWYDFLDSNAEDRPAYVRAMIIWSEAAVGGAWLLLAAVATISLTEWAAYTAFALCVVSSLGMLLQHYVTLRR